jgi:hypothetical protein
MDEAALLYGIALANHYSRCVETKKPHAILAPSFQRGLAVACSEIAYSHDDILAALPLLVEDKLHHYRKEVDQVIQNRLVRSLWTAAQGSSITLSC